jgi:hydroxymethylglutaryl-CoA reductase
MSRSRIPGFYNLSLSERLAELARAAGLAVEDLAAFSSDAGLASEQADHMIENVVGTHALPLGIALNFIVNGREVLVPMAVEEPSVVAGASFMAKLARAGGGFQAHVTSPEMIGQMQVLEAPDLPAARVALLEQKAQLLEQAAGIDPVFAAFGGRAARSGGAHHRRFAGGTLPGPPPDL